MLLLLSALAGAVSLSLVSEEQPYEGVTLRRYRTSGPVTDVWVARVDLCASGIEVGATRAPDSLQTVPSFGQEVGAQLAVNGDFYKIGPVRVYGRAIGEGVAWPLEQTGIDPGYSWEWFYGRPGWIAVGHDRVDFGHTEWVRDNLATSHGHVGDPPPGTLALVSGFPELVTEGVVRTCSDPGSTSCFPDRSDMADRHPRTAMGLAEDRGTLIFAVVDGRTSSSAGMRGAELADLMGQLGAWQAYNLDGGGSTAMWLEDRGTVNRPSDGSPRSVANHWAVFAGSGRPAHCEVATPCRVIPPEGGVIDDDSACFDVFGPDAYWREEAAGHGGHLFWTNAWQTDRPANWAWWQIHPAEAGEYRVEVWLEPGWALFDDARYSVIAGGVPTEVVVDQSAGDGWTELGAFEFAAGGDQFVAVYDDAVGDVPSGRHIAADALRLVRLDLPEEPDDTGVDGDTGDADSPGGGDKTGGRALAPSSGCSVTPAGISWWFIAALFGIRGRGRRGEPSSRASSPSGR